MGRAGRSPKTRSAGAGGKDRDFPVVGIGMSAGGLEAVVPFLNAMPADSGMGFVIVQHLEPSRTSLLAELLGRHTAMPVVDIEDGMRIEPNRVHVIVPAKTLLINDGVLRLVEPQEPRAQRHPVDKFLAALAEDRQARAIGVVLTGAGSNGTAGLMAIKRRRAVHRAGSRDGGVRQHAPARDRLRRGRLCARPRQDAGGAAGLCAPPLSRRRHGVRGAGGRRTWAMCWPCCGRAPARISGVTSPTPCCGGRIGVWGWSTSSGSTPT